MPSAPATVDTSTPTSTTSTIREPPALDSGDLVGFAFTQATLGDELLTLAVADESALRARGLMGVTDLGSVDGMLFSWGGAEVTSRFTMRDTLIALTIGFFDTEGRFVSSTDMTPCEGEPCDTYAAAGPYAYAIEFPKGKAIDPTALLVLDR